MVCCYKTTLLSGNTRFFGQTHHSSMSLENLLVSYEREGNISAIKAVIRQAELPSDVAHIVETN